MDKKTIISIQYYIEGHMKKMLFILMIMCFIPLYSFADDVEDRLPSDTPARVKESARQVISLGVQNQGVINMTKTMLENRYTERQMLAAHEVLMNAQRQNLETGPIMNKFYESVAKKERATRSIKVMERVRSNYETAGRLAGKMTQDKEQVRAMTQEMAECMNAGVSNKNMVQIATMLRLKTRDMKEEDARAFNKATLDTVRQMAQAGAGSGNVTRIVKNAFQKGYTVKDMEKLANSFMAQVKNASSARYLANSYANAIRNGATPDNVGNYSQGDPPGFGMRGPGSGFGSAGPGGGRGDSMGGGGRGRR